MNAAVSAAKAKSPNRPAPPNIPAPTPAFLPFSVSSTLASSISCRMSVCACSVASLTRSPSGRSPLCFSMLPPSEVFLLGVTRWGYRKRLAMSLAAREGLYAEPSRQEQPNGTEDHPEPLVRQGGRAGGGVLPLRVQELPDRERRPLPGELGQGRRGRDRGVGARRPALRRHQRRPAV